MRRHRAASLVLFSSLLLGAVAHGQPAGSLGEDFIYRVRAGDTLINIANTYTRNSANWNPLQSLNKIVAPEQLPIGLELHIPLSMIPVRPAEARVVHVSGQASAAGKTLAPGASLPEGSTIVTAPNGFVTLELADGSKLTLPADGSVELSRMRQFEGTGLTDSVRVQRAAWSPVAPEGQGVGRFEIRTPVAVTGVRGTRFRVQSGSGGVHSEVLEGSVRLQPHAPAPAGQARGRGPRLRRGGRRAAPTALAAPAPAVNGPARSSRCPAPRAIWCAYRATPMARSPCLPRFSPATTSVFAPPARHHVSVRAVDDLGLHGQDAVATFEGMSQLSTAFGLGVATGTGGFVTLTDY